jgi:L-threonylcarbamoyladenylate synthase
MIRPDSEETREHAADIILTGGLVAFRTDTFYGLGVDPLNPDAVARLKDLKGREDGKPILLLIADMKDVDRFTHSKPAGFEKLSAALWPGPLTIVLPAGNALPGAITGGTGTVGLRLPDDEAVRQFLRACGGSLTATSANPSGRNPARSALEVVDYFSSAVDLIVDGGDVTATKPSTVVDVSQTPAKLIREGAVAREQLEEILRDRLG